MPIFSRILCPVDFSDTSAHAVRYAAAMATWFHSQLTLQHVYGPLFMPVPGLPPPVDRVPPGEVDRLAAEVRSFATTVGCGHSLEVVVDVGRPSDEIVARAVRHRMDLVVMGTHGQGGFAHLVLGSVAEKVLRQVACPVLTVPPRAHAMSVVPFRNVVCAVDFSEWSSAALLLAASVAERSAATLHVLHAIEWPWTESPIPDYDDLPAAQADALLEFRRYMTDRAAKRLDATVMQVIDGRCNVRTEVVHGKAHVEVMRAAAAHDADLIVLGVHGRSTLDVAVFGSTTNQVVRHAECPVLTVRR